MDKARFFLIPLIIAIFNLGISLEGALPYSSPDIPVRHWSYEAVEKLAMAGLLGLSGIDTKPMTRVQMAHKVKEAIDNVENENLPAYLSFDREHVEYLQRILYKLINEFRQELILIGVTTAEMQDSEERPAVHRFFNYNLASPLKAENRFASVKSRKDILLENENGLRVEEGYNLRTRAYPWINLHIPFDRPPLSGAGFTFSAVPALRISENGTEFYLDEAAAKFSAFNIEVALAKGAMWWGPGFHGSMLLSNNAKPLNLVRVRTITNFRFPWIFENLGLFGVNFFISRLEKDRTVKEPNFAGLRLEWSPLPYISLGASRSSIMGGRGRPKPRLKDYWKIFTARSKDEFTTGEAKRTDTDQLASLDVKFIMPFRPEARIASAMEAYMEWAGEDRFSFWENESPGLLLGLFFTDLLRDKGTDFRVEYAKNKSAWYDHGLFNAAGAATAYTYKGEIMGHHMGGDSDDMFFRISKDFPFLQTPYFDSVKGGFQLDIERHGLSRAVREKKIEVAFDNVWLHADTLSFSLRYELEDYRNFNFESGKGARNHIFLAQTDIKF